MGMTDLMGNPAALAPSIEAGMEGVTEALNRSAVEALSAADPEWLRERRMHSWSVYEQTPMPTTRLEEWRYTDLGRLLDLDALALPEVTAPADGGARPTLLQTAMEEDEAASGHLVLLDGQVIHRDLIDELAQQGVILTSLRQAVVEHEALVREHLGTEALPPEEGKFPALNGALWRDGVFVYIPRGVRVELPIRVTRWISRSGSALFTRTLIVAEPMSQLSYFDELLSDDLEEQTLVSGAVEVVARDGAHVQYVSVQRLGRGAFHQAAQRTLAGRDSTLNTLNVSLGASVARVDLTALLIGTGASSEMMGLYFADGNQHFDHNTRQDHLAPHTYSDLLYKGALDGEAHGVFRGIIRVHKGAQKTDAYQTNRNLLLSGSARADSLPNLEIEADDVKCSHGATVGQLDEEARFYLMSRGLSRIQAERLVVLGFLGEVLGRLPLGGVATKVTRVIEQKLAHHG